MKQLKWILGVFWGVILVTNEAWAGVYVLPKAGYLFDFDGNSSGIVGARSGYELDFKLVRVAVEAGYTYVDRTNDTSLVDVSGIVGIPLLPILDVYALGGRIVYPSDNNFKAGLGLELGIPFIDILSLGATAILYSYSDQDDLVETAAYISLRF